MRLLRVDFLSHVTAEEEEGFTFTSVESEFDGGRRRNCSSEVLFLCVLRAEEDANEAAAGDQTQRDVRFYFIISFKLLCLGKFNLQQLLPASPERVTFVRVVVWVSVLSRRSENIVINFTILKHED